MRYTPAAAALLVRSVGGTDDEAVFLASVMPGESGGDPAIVNTSGYCGVNLRAVGLFQICEYPERGTRAQLQDPHHNASAALDILRTQGRAAWSADADPDAAEEARQALAGGGTPMEGWHPRASREPASSGGSTYVGVPWKLVIHTIEGNANALYSYNQSNYFGHNSWPQATIDRAGIHQHRPITESGSALYNARGGVETNRANAIQVEVMGQAAHIAELPESTWEHLADWLMWCSEQTGAPLAFAEFNADGAYGEDAPQRFGGQEWLDFTGICGHQHVPENDHWDPGALPIDRLTRLFGTPVADEPQEEDDMPKMLKLPDGKLYMQAGVEAHHVKDWDRYLELVEKGLLPGQDKWVEVTETQLRQFRVT